MTRCAAIYLLIDAAAVRSARQTHLAYHNFKCGSVPYTGAALYDSSAQQQLGYTQHRKSSRVFSNYTLGPCACTRRTLAAHIFNLMVFKSVYGYVLCNVVTIKCLCSVALLFFGLKLQLKIVKCDVIINLHREREANIYLIGRKCNPQLKGKELWSTRQNIQFDMRCAQAHIYATSDCATASRMWRKRLIKNINYEWRELFCKCASARDARFSFRYYIFKRLWCCWVRLNYCALHRGKGVPERMLYCNL